MKHKLNKIEVIKMWINDLTTNAFGMEKLQPYNGDELERLSIKQLDMITKLITTAYHKGHEDCRQVKKSLT